MAGAFAIFDQFLWLPLEGVEWICSELKPQQTRLGTDGTVNQLFADIQSSGLYFLLIHCESRENSGCHTEAFISQLLAFGNDFRTNNFQNRATVLPHDICCFFCCCVLVTLPLSSQITDSMSTQKTINKTSHLCMLYQTAVWHRWWKSKINLPPDLKLSSFFLLQRQRQSKNSAFMTDPLLRLGLASQVTERLVVKWLGPVSRCEWR